MSEHEGSGTRAVAYAVTILVAIFLAVFGGLNAITTGIARAIFVLALVAIVGGLFMALHRGGRHIPRRWLMPMFVLVLILGVVALAAAG